MTKKVLLHKDFGTKSVRCYVVIVHLEQIEDKHSLCKERSHLLDGLYLRLYAPVAIVGDALYLYLAEQLWVYSLSCWFLSLSKLMISMVVASLLMAFATTMTCIANTYDGGRKCLSLYP